MSGAFFLLLCLTSTGSGDNGTLHIIRETGGKLEENMEEEEKVERITIKRYQCSKNSFTKTVGVHCTVQPHTNGQTEIIIL